MKPFSRFSLYALFLAVHLFFSGLAQAGPVPDAREGDVIFQITASPQSTAIQLATGSEYTHCGIVLKRDGRLHVFEAGKRVGWVPLDEWITSGIRGHYVLMRLKDASVLTKAAVAALHLETAYFAGRDYDLLFKWSDSRIYCSELVWKLYNRAMAMRLSKVRTFADYDLNHKEVQAIIRERYGHSFNPKEKVVAPSDLMESGLLEVVARN